MPCHETMLIQLRELQAVKREIAGTIELTCSVSALDINSRGNFSPLFPRLGLESQSGFPLFCVANQGGSGRCRGLSAKPS
jgi:hypothetical protein